MDPELKALVEESQKLLKVVREKDAEAAEERKRYGKESEETKAAIAKMDERFEAIDKRMDEIVAESKVASKGATSEERHVKAARHYAEKMGRDVSEEEAANHEKAFFQWMRHGKQGMAADERKNLIEDATGEILVTYDLDQELYRVLPQLNVLRPLMANRRTNKDRLRARSLTELSVGWGKLETGTAIAASSQTPAEAFMYVEDLYGLTKIGEDELMDSDYALEPIVSDSFGIAIANAEEAAFAAGTGHATSQPAGFLGAGPLTGFDGTDVIDVVSTHTDGSIDLSEFFDVEYSLKPQYARRAAWIVHRQSVRGMRKLKDANGRYLWVQGGVINGNTDRPVDNTFDGYPVYQSPAAEQFPTGVAQTTYPVVFGDFKAGYLILDRLGMTVQRLNELYAEAGLVGFKVHRRVGGGVIRGEAIARLKSAHA